MQLQKYCISQINNPHGGSSYSSQYSKRSFRFKTRGPGKYRDRDNILHVLILLYIVYIHRKVMRLLLKSTVLTAGKLMR